MNSFESQDSDRPLAELTLTAPVGVEIEVLDAGFSTVAFGVAPLNAKLPEGIYTVRWSAAGRREERLVRISGDRPTTEHGGEFPLGSAPPYSVASASPLERSQFRRATKVFSRTKAEECEVLVFIRSSNDRPRVDVARSVRLYDGDGERIRPRRSGPASSADLDLKVAARRFQVPAGSYLLRFQTNDRRTVEQTICVFEGRRTVAFLKYGTALIAQQGQDATRFVRRRGIEPTQSTFVSVPLGEPLELEEMSRIADILLHKLATDEPLHDWPLLGEVAAGDADPYLKLYAAALLLDPRASIPADDPPAPANLEAAAMLLDTLPADGANPDLRCLTWRLASLGFPMTSTGDGGPLLIPPMLECCWRWAAANSVENDQQALSPSMAAASGSTRSTAPWLTWGVVPTRKSVSVLQVPIEDLLPHLEQIASSAATLMSRQNYELELPELDKALSQLSSTTIDIANAAVSAVKMSADPAEIAKMVAFSTGTPGAVLGSQVEQALEELRRAEESSA